MQALFNATGYGVAKKLELFQKQVQFFIGEEALQQFDVLEFQQ